MWRAVHDIVHWHVMAAGISDSAAACHKVKNAFRFCMMGQPVVWCQVIDLQLANLQCCRCSWSKTRYSLYTA